MAENGKSGNFAKEFLKSLSPKAKRLIDVISSGKEPEEVVNAATKEGADVAFGVQLAMMNEANALVGEVARNTRRKGDPDAEAWKLLRDENVVAEAISTIGGKRIARYGDPQDVYDILMTLSSLGNLQSTSDYVKASDGESYTGADYQIIGGVIGEAVSIRGVYFTTDAIGSKPPMTRGNGVQFMIDGMDESEQADGARVLSPSAFNDAIERLKEASRGQFNPPMVSFEKKDVIIYDFEHVPLSLDEYGRPNQMLIINAGGAISEVTAVLAGLQLAQGCAALGRTTTAPNHDKIRDTIVASLKGVRKEE